MSTRGTGLKSARTARDDTGAAASRAGHGEAGDGLVMISPEEIAIRDLELTRGLDELAHYIQVAKREIAALCPDQIRHEHIPAATDELDAIAAHTEEATGSILDAAERIETLAADVPGEAGQAIGSAVTRIYEACNFQDITGQRIAKVVATLKHIEERIGALAAVVGDDPEFAARAGSPRGPTGESAATSSEETLLNGPQLPGGGNNQDEVDALLEGGD